jgi:replicative DNA helicase
MAEERIAERIDANLMDIAVDDLKSLPKDIYDKKLSKISSGMTGKLIIKEYPTATANVDHFRHLLDELRLKKNFKPDVVFIDYLNICASSRFKAGANVNSYTYIKAIAEELRGLAVQLDFPIFTATQTNRSGFSNTDVELTDTSESFGLPATADLMFAIIATEQLDESGQIMVKQLKNRYNDPTLHRRFILGIDRSKMKLYDVQEDDQVLFEQMGKGSESVDDEEDMSKFKIKKPRSLSGWGE